MKKYYFRRVLTNDETGNTERYYHDYGIGTGVAGEVGWRTVGTRLGANRLVFEGY